MGYGYGRGYGVHHLGGAGDGAPDPGQLSNMVLRFSVPDGSVPTAEANHTPGTPYHMLSTQTLTNIASGSARSFTTFESALASGRPYYHTADWVITNPAMTVSMPNGKPFIATNNSADAGLTNCTQIRVNLDAKTTLQSEYSGIVVMNFISDAVQRNPVELRGTGTYSVVKVGEDDNWTCQDSVTSGLVTVPVAQENHKKWCVCTWEHTAAGGFKSAVNGHRSTMTAGAASLTGNMEFDEIMGTNTVLTTAFAEVILYEAGHSLADLDVPAAELATYYGITYAVS
jgi:hypothetical protein